MTSSGTPSRRPKDIIEGADAVVVLNHLVAEAFQVGASDIHLEPKAELMQVRVRVDGRLVEQRPVAHDVALQVVSRVKVLARMDITERRVPQDGQFALDLGTQHRVHVRASTFPCSQGEKVVLRLLRGSTTIAFEKLGMSPESQKMVRDLVVRPQGFVVTCGPTGSGKTSTLYSFLQLIDTSKINVVTLEDPIEVELPSITQGQANPRAGFTFALGLRAILRQDPDVILVGEIRDSETAGIALQAALTGHMVMSTLHTSDTVETIVRLVDLGIEPWIIANSLTAVIAQRLVRVVCPSCVEPYELENDFYDGDQLLMPAGTVTIRPRGCTWCLRTGYRGRTALYEVLENDDELRDLIKTKGTAPLFRMALKRRGFTSLRRVGYEKVLAGITTIDEVIRVTT
ncbi:MAG: GspE/PulE family protein [Polyangiaceae bacterium]